MRKLLFYYFVFISLINGQNDLGYTPAPTFNFSVFDTLLVDQSRAREIKISIYRPEREHGVRVFPVIILSPEIISEDGDYHFLLEFWAKSGFITIIIFHPKYFNINTNEVNTLKYVKELELASEHISRPLDLKFILDEIFWNRIDFLRGRADVSKIGVAGHAFGVHTAFVLCGQTFTVKDSLRNLSDSRVSAMLALSAQGPDIFGLAGNSWDSVTVPVMIMTGTNDKGVGIHDEFDRRWAYERVPAKPKYFVYLEGGTKYSFSDLQKRGYREVVRNPFHHKWIGTITTAYWKSILVGDNIAQEWLGSGTVDKITNEMCKIEFEKE